MFPAAAALAWAVLVYIGIDFGFWGKMFDMSAQRRAHLARRRGDRPRRDAARLSVRLSQSQPLACARLACRRRLAGLSRRAGRRSPSMMRRSPPASRAFRSSPSPRVGFILVLYLSTHGYDRAVMLIPTWFLLLVWVIAAGFTVTGSLTNDLVSPALDRRPGADRHADRLHGDAERLCRRRPRPWRDQRCPSARPGARPAAATSSSIGMSIADQGLSQPRSRSAIGPLARRARRAGLGMARISASVRARPLSRQPRYDARAEARAHQSGIPLARRGRALFLVPAEGAPGRRRRAEK